MAFPLWDYLVSWPAFERKLKANPTQAKIRLWTVAIVWPWLVVGAGIALWLYNDRAWIILGLALPTGWRLWVAILLVLLLVLYMVYAAAAVARDPKAKESVRQQMSGQISAVMPHTQKEMALFGGVSVTAGFCEEFLFRGFLIWALTPWISWWGAAALSVVIFAIGHAYQGLNGVIRTGIVGIFFTLVVAISGSLWPSILLHAVLDVGQGMIAWLALRGEKSASASL